MRTPVAEIKEAIEHLPTEALLVLEDVTWEQYEQLVNQLEVDWPGMRLTYDRGRLEVMSPSRRHEQCKEFIAAVVRVLCEELHLQLQSSGSTTWKKKKQLQGTEPDASFHIANASRVVGKDELDLDRDPPPDLVIEVDVTNESRRKFPFYAHLCVPEIWVYVTQKNLAYFYELRGASYHELKASPSFPPLTCEVLAEFLKRIETDGEIEVLESFRKWLRGQ